MFNCAELGAKLKISPRYLASGATLLFGILPIFLGIESFIDLGHPWIGYFCCLLYFLGIVPTVALYRGWFMPTYQAVFNLAVAAFVPFLMLQILSNEVLGNYDTWFIGAIATLLGATAVRGHSYLAVIGLVALITQVLLWGGLKTLTTTGIFGAVLFVAAGSLMSLGFQQVGKEAEEHNRESLERDVRAAFRSAAAKEFDRRISLAMKTALPILSEISEVENQISDDLKGRARRLEASLRDEIRGDQLISDEVRLAVAAARERGIEVTLLDEGGLASESEESRHRILREVSQAISSVQSGRITVRAPLDPEFKVSVLGTRSGESKPDLWLKLR